LAPDPIRALLLGEGREGKERPEKGGRGYIQPQYFSQVGVSERSDV